MKFSLAYKVLFYYQLSPHHLKLYARRHLLLII